jgi:FkbM family methyltransferase
MDLLDVSKALITPGSCVFDVGGHTGKVTSEFAVLVGSSGEVYTFEPHPVLYFELSALSSIAEENKVGRIRPYCKALSDSVGHTTFHISRFMDQIEFNQASSIEQTLANEARLGDNFISIMVETDTIDNFCRTHFVAPTFIKIDTEGADYRVIRGAQKTIERYRPAIITEFGYDPYQDLPTNITEHLSLLESAGYALFVADILFFNGIDTARDHAFKAPKLLPFSVEEISGLPCTLGANILALPRYSQRYDRPSLNEAIGTVRALQFLRR